MLYDYLNDTIYRPVIDSELDYHQSLYAHLTSLFFLNHYITVGAFQAKAVLVRVLFLSLALSAGLR